MRSPEEVLRARTLIGAARDFLLEKGKEGSAPTTFEFHAGALYAIEWMLSTHEGDHFDRYLASLKSMQHQMIAGQP